MATDPTARPLRLPPPADRERSHAAARQAIAELRAGRQHGLVDVAERLDELDDAHELDELDDDHAPGPYRVLALPAALDRLR